MSSRHVAPGIYPASGNFGPFLLRANWVCGALLMPMLVAMGCTKSPSDQAKALVGEHKWVEAFDLLEPLAMAPTADDHIKTEFHNLCMGYVQRTESLHNNSKKVPSDEMDKAIRCLEFTKSDALWRAYLLASDGEDGGDEKRRIQWLGMWIGHRVRIDKQVAEAVALAKSATAATPGKRFFSRVAPKVDSLINSCMTFAAWAARSGDLKTAAELAAKCAAIKGDAGDGAAARAADLKVVCAAVGEKDKAFKCPELAGAAPAKAKAAGDAAKPAGDKAEAAPAKKK